MRRNHLVRHGALWLAELDKPNAISARVAADFRQLESQHLSQLLPVVAQMDSIAPEALIRRLSIGRRCYTAWVDDSIAAYGWLTCGREWVGEFERELNIQDDEAYIWDCATLPAYRHQRLFSALLSNVAQQLARQGLRRLWIIAVITAPAMNRGIADAGFVPILNLTYLPLSSQRLLLTIPSRGAVAQRVAAARRLLKQNHEYLIGPLLIGSAPRVRPPDTHINL